LKGFYPAEAYHQGYLARHPDQPYIIINDLPKITRLKRELPDLCISN
jgi:peptide-methionine (S)-S-oxide reductase